MVDNSVSHIINNNELDIKIINQYENIEKKGRFFFNFKEEEEILFYTKLKIKKH